MPSEQKGTLRITTDAADNIYGRDGSSGGGSGHYLGRACSSPAAMILLLFRPFCARTDCRAELTASPRRKNLKKPATRTTED